MMSRFWVRFLILGIALMLSFHSNILSAADSAPVVGDAKPTTVPDDKKPDVLVAQAPAAAPADQKTAEEKPAPAKEAAKDSGGPEVHLLGLKTDIAKRYRWIVPPFPFPPFTNWRRWFREHEVAVHCMFEWRDDQGQWWRGELRSTHFDENAANFRVGYGEFPGTAYDAYGIYIVPGRQPRDVDSHGKPIDMAIDEIVNCDYRQVEAELRQYAAKYAHPGDPGTGGHGERNVGLGGPAYKPAQNSNSMVNYILKHCGVNHPSPDLAVGWDRVPHFPYSSDTDMPALDCRPSR